MACMVQSRWNCKFERHSRQGHALHPLHAHTDLDATGLIILSIDWGMRHAQLAPQQAAVAKAPSALPSALQAGAAAPVRAAGGRKMLANEPDCCNSYTVKPGDTLASIATAYGQPTTGVTYLQACRLASSFPCRPGCNSAPVSVVLLITRLCSRYHFCSSTKHMQGSILRYKKRVVHKCNRIFAGCVLVPSSRLKRLG